MSTHQPHNGSKGKLKAIKAELPYKKTISSKPIVEDVEKSTAKFGGSKYEMILYAALRAYELAKGSEPMVEAGNKPTVTALLEIQAGHVGRDYIPEAIRNKQ